jgi:hypothetical protein
MPRGGKTRRQDWAPEPARLIRADPDQRDAGRAQAAPHVGEDPAVTVARVAVLLV